MLIPPRFGIGEYTSNDENDPDEIIFKIISLNTFETDHEICVIVELKTDHGFMPRTFPLKPWRNDTSVLWELWKENIKSKNFKKGKIICLHTWRNRQRHWKLPSV
jgi:hypothetical protein